MRDLTMRVWPDALPALLIIPRRQSGWWGRTQLFAPPRQSDKVAVSFTTSFTEAATQGQKPPEATRSVPWETRVDGLQTRVQSGSRDVFAVFESAGRPFESGRVRHSKPFTDAGFTVRRTSQLC